MIDQIAKGLRNRVQMMVGRAVLSAVSDATKAQTLQLELLAGETADGVERFQEYGFTSVPFAGAEAVMVSIGGLRSHGIVVAVEDRRYRLTGLAGGEVALYDDQGQKVHLQRAQILITSPNPVVINSAAKVEVTAPEVDVISNAVNLGAAGGQAVARVGDTVAGGVITSGSATVRSA